MLQWAWESFEILISVLLNKYPEVGRLDPMVGGCRGLGAGGVGRCCPRERRYGCAGRLCSRPLPHSLVPVVSTAVHLELGGRVDLVLNILTAIKKCYFCSALGWGEVNAQIDVGPWVADAAAPDGLQKGLE